jgi:hypothetical protein
MEHIMGRADLRPAIIREDRPLPAPSANVSFVVMRMARSDGRSGADGIRRYNFDSIAAAPGRFDVESVNSRVHRVELLTIVASRTVSR